jgi:acylphosphatase
MAKAALRAELRERMDCAAVVERAAALGLLGWVREDDGVVRVHAEGPPEAVAELRAALGPVAEERARVEGHEQFAIRGVPAGDFAVVEDDGGYELRLEVDGGTRAWRLRKEPVLDPAVKRTAIASAPGEGGRTWDAGPYEQGGRVPWPEAIERGHAVFVLHGRRLRGGFALQRTRGDAWLLVKRRDEHAVTSSG